jgi:hypothetical protein
MPTMGWQEPIALTMVAMTGGFFLWHYLRPKRWNARRSNPCGCGSGSSQVAPRHSVVYHVRKGSRPQIIIKMK